MEEKNSEKVRKYYDRLQSSYNLVWMNKKNLAMHLGVWDKETKSHHQALINENRYIANALDIKEDDVLLDAGCGVGGTAIWIAEQYGVNVTGISINENQVGPARKYAKDRGVDGLVKFELRNYLDTKFPDQSFTKIYAIESICHAENKEDFFKEAYRLLKPGGKLAIIDEFVSKDNLNQKEKKLLNDWLEGWAVPNMLTVKKFKEGLKKTGFKNIEDIDITQKVIRSSGRIQIIGFLFYPFDTVMSKIGLVSKEEYSSTIASVRQKTLFKRKIVDFRVIKCQK